MSKIVGWGMGWLLLAAPLWAQDDIPLLRPEEREVIDDQANQVIGIIEPVLQAAGESTVRIWAGTQRLAYGTVIGQGDQVLTKWSQVDLDGGGPLLVESSKGEVVAAVIEGVYADDDLAVLKLEGATKWKPVNWDAREMKLGSFLAAAQPGGRLAGFGVMSVLERSLRDTDKAYLGILGEVGYDGKGVKIEQVTESSAAAVAGLVVGDVITRVGEREVSGLMELQNALFGKEPGSSVRISFLRGGKSRDVDVILGSRPKFPNPIERRMQRMETMGTDVSQVRDSFPSAIQTDMGLEPNQVGGPVVDLDGHVVGITLARADRTRSFIMSSRAVGELLAQAPEDPAAARARMQQAFAETSRGMPQRGGAVPGVQRAPDPRQLNHHLQEMRRLMQMLRDEMEMLEGR